ncbi:hypothetical protein DXG01_000526, partial [Tephrocybe rancida]
MQQLGMSKIFFVSPVPLPLTFMTANDTTLPMTNLTSQIHSLHHAHARNTLHLQLQTTPRPNPHRTSNHHRTSTMLWKMRRATAIILFLLGPN